METSAPVQLLLITFFFFFFFFFFSSLFTLGSCSSTGHIRGFGVQLIHRDSPLSPLYNPNATDQDRWAFMEELSLKRLQYYNQLMSNAAVLSNQSVQIPVVPGTSLYIMKMRIGSPPVDTFVAVDTGSNLNWIQCKPCIQCYKQFGPIFDPSQSTTFQKVICPSLACSLYPNSQCNSDYFCNYKYGYADKSYTTGEAVSDDFTVRVPESGIDFPLQNILFGCAHTTTDGFSRDLAGIIGLGPNELSFIGQVGPAVDYKFSYCLVQRTDKESGSQMLFGSMAVLSGKPTPMAVPLEESRLYYLNLDDISVGLKRLNIPPGTFRRKPNGRGGMVLDSGTPLTFLENTGYDILASELKRVIPLENTVRGSDRFCYYGTSLDLQNRKVPTVTFHFELGLDVPLSPLSTFLEITPGVLCANFRPRAEYSLFGALFQQNLIVGHDLLHQKIYMTPADCATF